MKNTFDSHRSTQLNCYLLASVHTEPGQIERHSDAVRRAEEKNDYAPALSSLGGGVEGEGEGGERPANAHCSHGRQDRLHYCVLCSIQEQAAVMQCICAVLREKGMWWPGAGMVTADLEVVHEVVSKDDN